MASSRSSASSAICVARNIRRAGRPATPVACSRWPAFISVFVFPFALPGNSVSFLVSVIRCSLLTAIDLFSLPAVLIQPAHAGMNIACVPLSPRFPLHSSWYSLCFSFSSRHHFTAVQTSFASHPPLGMPSLFAPFVPWFILMPNWSRHRYRMTALFPHRLRCIRFTFL